MRIDDVLKNLKKYNFDDIMSLSEIIAINEYSFFNRKELEKVNVFPHELEIFVVLSILSCSDTENDMVEISRSVFFEIINTIKNFTPKAYSKGPKNIKFLISKATPQN